MPTVADPVNLYTQKTSFAPGVLPRTTYAMACPPIVQLTPDSRASPRGLVRGPDPTIERLQVK